MQVKKNPLKYKWMVVTTGKDVWRREINLKEN